jgi:hypothetical protein
MKDAPSQFDLWEMLLCRKPYHVLISSPFERLHRHPDTEPDGSVGIRYRLNSVNCSEIQRDSWNYTMST